MNAVSNTSGNASNCERTERVNIAARMRTCDVQTALPNLKTAYASHVSDAGCASGETVARITPDNNAQAATRRKMRSWARGMSRPSELLTATGGTQVVVTPLRLRLTLVVGRADSVGLRIRRPSPTGRKAYSDRAAVPAANLGFELSVHAYFLD